MTDALKEAALYAPWQSCVALVFPEKGWQWWRSVAEAAVAPRTGGVGEAAPELALPSLAVILVVYVGFAYMYE